MCRFFANHDQDYISVDYNWFHLSFAAPGPQGNDGNGGFNIMFILMAWLVAAVILFLLRPQNMRQSGNEKPSNQVDLSFPPYSQVLN